MTYEKLYKELAVKVEKDYGPKCKKYALGCPTCMAWQIVDDVDFIVQDTDPKNWKEIKSKQVKKK